VINSPGGSPVQAALIHDRIRALAKERGIKVMTFAEDVAASGGYMLALAGDEIYAHPNSIVGSIGVVSAGFGFEKLIEKIGVDRRVYHAGERKAMLDPFKPEDPKDVAHLESLQREVHESFKQMVRDRRANKLTADEKDLFSGAFWTGAKAKEMGLIDGLGDLRTICRQKFGDKVEFQVITPRRPWFSLDTFTSRSDHEPRADFATGMIAALEERALWSRFGL
ncbi:MAG: S49 family peptidase, partial [Micropepsaceae bacterium]